MTQYNDKKTGSHMGGFGDKDNQTTKPGHGQGQGQRQDQRSNPKK